MHILKALKLDHDKVKELLNELVNLNDTDSQSRKDLVEDIRDELIPHSRVEESVFYNSLRVASPDSSEVMHGFKEHIEAETLLRALQVEDTLNAPWKATAVKLKEALEHHIQEEEEKIFAIARKVISDAESEELGKLYEQLKPQVKDENFLKTSFEMIVNLLPPKFSAGVKKLVS